MRCVAFADGLNVLARQGMEVDHTGTYELQTFTVRAANRKYSGLSSEWLFWGLLKHCVS